MNRLIASITVVLKPEWHKLTDWKHIRDVYEYYPSIYNEWVKNGLIPYDKRVLSEKPQSETFDF